ncbi:MAG: TonB family protein [Terriglobales bacterium]
MLPHPTSRSASTSAPGASIPPPLPLPDLALLLEQHVVAGFPPDLALDLVLNELVARAADATHASAAALALLRGKLMVCRAATGLHAPDLGVPLDTRDGLSGACARSRTPQVSDDTECDPRVDPAISRRLGIRSMLVVPVFAYKKTATDRNPPLTGVLEVFSPVPNTFTEQAQILLADFADECARIHNVSNQLQSRPRTEIASPDDDLILSDKDAAAAEHAETSSLATNDAGVDQQVMDDGAVQAGADVRPLLIDEELATQVPELEVLPSSEPAPALDRRLPFPLSRQPYEIWTLILGGLVILAAAAFSFMIGSRIGWLHSQPSPPAIAAQSTQTRDPAPPAAVPSPPGAKAKSSAHGKHSERTSAEPQNKEASKSKPQENPPGTGDELVVYNNGKLVFRMKPTIAETRKPSATGHASAQPTSSVPRGSIWLAPAEAESRLVTRTEPQYPADALAAHRSGNVTLEVQVAEDGTVSSVNTLSGDPLLAPAAAEAVRNWRYHPYRANNRPSQFQTDVTLTFSLPN